MAAVAVHSHTLPATSSIPSGWPRPGTRPPGPGRCCPLAAGWPATGPTRPRPTGSVACLGRPPSTPIPLTGEAGSLSARAIAAASSWLTRVTGRSAPRSPRWCGVTGVAVHSSGVMPTGRALPRTGTPRRGPAATCRSPGWLLSFEEEQVLGVGAAADRLLRAFGASPSAARAAVARGTRPRLLPGCRRAGSSCPRTAPPRARRAGRQPATAVG